MTNVPFTPAPEIVRSDSLRVVYLTSWDHYRARLDDPEGDHGASRYLPSHLRALADLLEERGITDHQVEAIRLYGQDMAAALAVFVHDWNGALPADWTMNHYRELGE